MAQLGMVGLGRMGSNIVRRLMKDGHDCVVYDISADAVKDLADEGATGVSSLKEMAEKLDAPRSVWVMVPAGEITESSVHEVADALVKGDAIIDGGNSHYHDDIRRSTEFAERGIDYIDCGTSGGVWGLERGYCLMIGGPDKAVEAPGPDLRLGRSGRRRDRPHAGAQGQALGLRAGLLPLRPLGRRALREDGPQRHRVRADGRLRRGPQHHPQRRRGQAEARRRRRDRPARAPRALPVRDRHLRGGRGLAPRQRRRLLAARPRRRGAVRVADARRVRRPRLATRARAAGPRWRRSRRASRRPC